MTPSDILSAMERVSAGLPLELPPGLWGTLLAEAFDHPHQKTHVEFQFKQAAQDRVILVSGGLDSTAAYFLSQQQGLGKTIPVYCKINVGYEEHELAVLDKFHIKPHIVDYSSFKHNWERFGYMIPGRNLLFILSALSFLPEGGEIWLSATEGEIKLSGGDKSWSFLTALNSILGTLPYPIRVRFVWAGWTKTDIVAWWLKNVPDYDVRDTLSCQSGLPKHCGKCQACFRRWVAFKNNDIEAEWGTEPPNLKDPIIRKKIAEACRVSRRGYRFPYEEMSERAASHILHALKKARIDISSLCGST